MVDDDIRQRFALVHSNTSLPACSIASNSKQAFLRQLRCSNGRICYVHCLAHHSRHEVKAIPKVEGHAAVVRLLLSLLEETYLVCVAVGSQGRKRRAMIDALSNNGIKAGAVKLLPFSLSSISRGFEDIANLGLDLQPILLRLSQVAFCIIIQLLRLGGLGCNK